MNQLMNVEIKMTSLDIAELTGKEHKNVMRDIRKEIEELGEEIGRLIFEQSSYLNSQNKEQPCFTFGKKGAMQLALKYDAETRFKVIERIEEMEKQLTINTQALSPELQMFNQMFTAVARIELGSAEQEKRLSLVEKKQDNITEVLSLNPTEWRKKTSNLLNKIAQQRGGFGAYQEVRTEAYQLLEDRAKCQLSIRLTNKKRKAALEGLAKSKIDKINKMDVIADDARLVEIFLAVVKELVIKHNVEVESA